MLIATGSKILGGRGRVDEMRIGRPILPHVGVRQARWHRCCAEARVARSSWRSRPIRAGDKEDRGFATGNEAVPTEWPDRIGTVAARELALNGYTRYEQLTTVTPKELSKIHGIGPKAIRVLDEELRARGLSFAPTGDRANQSLPRGAPR
jgi:hypothetical protein